MPLRPRFPLLGGALAIALLGMHACDNVACGCTPPLEGIGGAWRGISSSRDTVALDLWQRGDEVTGSGLVRPVTGAGLGSRRELDVTGTATRGSTSAVRLVATGWYDAPLELVGTERRSAQGWTLMLRYHRGPTEEDSVTLELRRP